MNSSGVSSQKLSYVRMLPQGLLFLINKQIHMCFSVESERPSVFVWTGASQHAPSTAPAHKSCPGFSRTEPPLDHSPLLSNTVRTPSDKSVWGMILNSGLGDIDNGFGAVGYTSSNNVFQTWALKSQFR